MNVVAVTVHDLGPVVIQFHDNHHVGMPDAPAPTIAIDVNSIISYELRIERGDDVMGVGRAHLNIDTLGATRGLTFQLPTTLDMLHYTLDAIDRAMQR